MEYVFEHQKYVIIHFTWLLFWRLVDEIFPISKINFELSSGLKPQWSNQIKLKCSV